MTRIGGGEDAVYRIGGDEFALILRDTLKITRLRIWSA